MFWFTKSTSLTRSTISKTTFRRLSTPKNVESGATSGPIEKSVYISQSQDIFTNLALEDWFYRNSEFSTHRILLLWRNTSAVVIGRHQNIWTEVDLDMAEKQGVSVARRNSGGGTVYHDTGNLNCSFFMPRAQYNRKYNLNIIQRALRRDGVNVEINCKEDLTLDGAKISGTASKLGKNSYHHCTLLVNSDLTTLSALLNPNTEGIESRATKSIKSRVQNLKSSNPAVTVDSALASIGHEFLRTDGNGGDGGEELMKKQRGFHFVNPTEHWFPGIDSICNEFKSWAWKIGKTPEFTIKRSIPISSSSSEQRIEVELKVLKGLVDSAQITQVPLAIENEKEARIAEYLTKCQGQPFSMDIIQNLKLVAIGQELPVNRVIRDFTSSTNKTKTGVLLEAENLSTMRAI